MKVTSFLSRNLRAIVSIISLLAISKSGNAVEAARLQSTDINEESLNPNQTTSKKSLKACVRHPKLAKLFCAKAQQMQDVRKNIPEIDPVTRPEEDLLNVTDEESDTAVEIFGCDCIA